MTLASDALAIARAGIHEVNPARAVRRNFIRTQLGFRLGGHRLRPGPGGQVRIVAVGKAAGAMADAAARVVGSPLSGIAVTPRGYPVPRSAVVGVFGDHPVPGVRSQRAGRALLEFVRSTAPNDVVVFLVSGGGSAVAEAPAESIRAEDLSRATEVLLASGVPIGAMNAIRRHISLIKGGQLARATVARAFGTLALSDVVGDVPEDIASGPTVPDPSTYRDALRVARRYRLSSRLPARVVRRLREGARGRWPETPKPGDPRWAEAPFVLAATNRTAIEAAAREARRRRYEPRIVPRPLVGETQPVARAFARRLRPANFPCGTRAVALIAGGETTVTLGPHPGRGGRNQEFSLAAAAEIAGRDMLVLSVGTDGIDGPTDAAGGWTDGGTVGRARQRGVDLERALARHAAYDALVTLGSLVRTGPTGTNVMDLHVGLARFPGQSG